MVHAVDPVMRTPVWVFDPLTLMSGRLLRSSETATETQRFSFFSSPVLCAAQPRSSSPKSGNPAPALCVTIAAASLAGVVYGLQFVYATDSADSAVHWPSPSSELVQLTLAQALGQAAVCVWHAPLGAPVFATPLLIEGRMVVVGAVDGSFCALSLCGNTLWRTLLAGPVFSSACLLSSFSPHLPLARERAGDDGPSVCGPDSERGPSMMAISVPDEDESAALICVGAHDGAAYVINLESGAIASRTFLGGQIFATPFPLHIPDKGKLAVVGTTEGSLHIINASNNGAVISSHTLRSPLYSSPVLWASHAIPDRACDAACGQGSTMRVAVGARDDLLYVLELDI
jgi:hypothetical protein